MRSRERLTLGLILTVGLGLVGGCGSTGRDKVPVDDAGTVKTGTRGLSIETIDGQPVPNPKRPSPMESVRVEPGHHLFEVSYSRPASSGSTWTVTGSVEMNVEAHKTYAIKHGTLGTGIVFWAEDTKTGDVVAGLRPRTPGEIPEVRYEERPGR
jgi:hypothetical protein